jgi:hypothetical protein
MMNPKKGIRTESALRRLMIPIYQRERTNALLMTVSSFLLLLLPFILLPFLLFSTTTIILSIINNFLLLIDLTTIALLFSSSAIQSKYTLFQNSFYTVGSPLAGVIIFFYSYHQFLMLLRKMLLFGKIDYILSKKVIEIFHL